MHVARAGRYALLTFGCKVNQYESAFLAQQLDAAGWQATALETADVIVLNSCTVTARADRQVRQAIRQARRRQPSARLVVTGCYAQRAPEEVAALPGVQAVLGNAVKAAWADYIQRLPQHHSTLVEVPDMAAYRQLPAMPIRHFIGHTRAFVKIQDGCAQRCSYCIVPAVRGPERSLPLHEVLRQLQTLGQAGYREMVLTGINLSRYGLDLPEAINLATLCQTLQTVTWPTRFRLSSLEPQDITPHLLEVLAGWPEFCPHFHLPLQSGADSVLQAMGRPYRTVWFVEMVQDLAARFPDAALGLDVLVGFPTETSTDFRRTKELLESLPITYLHVFPYSPRPGTPAAALPVKTSQAEVQARAQELRKLAMTKKQAFYQSQVGKFAEVLVEGAVPGRPGWLTGLTANYLRVHCPGPAAWANSVIRVRLEKFTGAYLVGQPLSEPEPSLP